MLKSKLLPTFVMTLTISLSAFADTGLKLSGSTKCLSTDYSSTIIHNEFNEDFTYSRTQFRYNDYSCKSLIQIYVAKGTYKIIQNKVSLNPQKISFFRPEATQDKQIHEALSSTVETQEYAELFGLKKIYESKATYQAAAFLPFYKKPQDIELKSANHFKLSGLEYYK